MPRFVYHKSVVPGRVRVGRVIFINSRPAADLFLFQTEGYLFVGTVAPYKLVVSAFSVFIERNDAQLLFHDFALRTFEIDPDFRLAFFYGGYFTVVEGYILPARQYLVGKSAFVYQNLVVVSLRRDCVGLIEAVFRVARV